MANTEADQGNFGNTLFKKISGHQCYQIEIIIRRTKLKVNQIIMNCIKKAAI